MVRLVRVPLAQPWEEYPPAPLAPSLLLPGATWQPQACWMRARGSFLMMLQATGVLWFLVLPGVALTTRVYWTLARAILVMVLLATLVLGLLEAPRARHEPAAAVAAGEWDERVWAKTSL